MKFDEIEILYGRINSKWLLENYTLIGAVIFLGRTVKKKRREEWSDNAIKAFRCNTGHFLSDHIFSSKDLTLNSTYLAAAGEMFDSKFSTLKRSWFLFHQTSKHCSFRGSWLESVQDFLIKLDIKPLMHLMEISTFSLNSVIIRLTKIMNRADNNWAHF